MVWAWTDESYRCRWLRKGTTECLGWQHNDFVPNASILFFLQWRRVKAWRRPKRSVNVWFLPSFQTRQRFLVFSFRLAGNEWIGTSSRGQPSSEHDRRFRWWPAFDRGRGASQLLLTCCRQLKFISVMASSFQPPLGLQPTRCLLADRLCTPLLVPSCSPQSVPGVFRSDHSCFPPLHR